MENTIIVKIEIMSNERELIAAATLFTCTLKMWNAAIFLLLLRHIKVFIDQTNKSHIFKVKLLRV